MYEFTPPSVKENPMGFGMLLRHYLTPQGISVGKLDGEYYEFRFADFEEKDIFDVVYEGGYSYTVSDEEAASLTSAGYDVVEI